MEQFLASGATALTLALSILWLFIQEKIVPFGRLADHKLTTERALTGWEKQRDATERLIVTVDRLTTILEGPKA